jgi:hypothetical protein
LALPLSSHRTGIAILLRVIALGNAHGYPAAVAPAIGIGSLTMGDGGCRRGVSALVGGLVFRSVSLTEL